MSANGSPNLSGNGADQVPIGQREIKPRDPNDPLATTTYKGQFYSREEANELIQREGHARAVEYNRRIMGGIGGRAAVHCVLRGIPGVRKIPAGVSARGL